MGESPNSVWLVSSLDNEDLRRLLGGDPRRSERSFTFDVDGRQFRASSPGSPSALPELGDRPADVELRFAERAIGEDRHLSDAEIEVSVVVVSFLENSEAVFGGLYHHDGIPYFFWDADSSRYELNTAIDMWNTPESFELRRRLRQSDIGATATKMSSRGDSVGLVVPVDEPAGRTKYQLLMEGDGVLEFLRRVDALSVRLGVASGIYWPHPWSRSAIVEPLALEAFVSEVRGESPASGSGVDEWRMVRATLIESVAVLAAIDRTILNDLPEDIVDDVVELTRVRKPADRFGTFGTA